MERTSRVLRFFGLSREAINERLQDILQRTAITAELTAQDEEIVLRLSGTDTAQLDRVTEQVADRMNVYLYSRQDQTLAARVVELLTQKGLTLALAESCTGGMVAASLTAVPGCSQVFGTGVVSYSCDCKEKLLHVRRDTLHRYGAVSDKTVTEMAQGVRRVGNARLGLSITGEAGPHPAEDHPVGTVYIALSDGRRTWVQRWQLDDGVRGRNGIRQAAASRALDLVRRYLEAYPAVMAGGILTDELEASAPAHRMRLPDLIPHRGEGLRRNLIKIISWIAIVAILIGIGWMVYGFAQAPDTNRRLQDSLRGMYWSEGVPTPKDDNNDAHKYPQGMLLRFRGLYDINNDVGGWVRIPDTVVDYPVVTYRNGYYMNHSFMGEYSYYGQPYLSRNQLEDSASPHTYVIYGNNTGDDQMFSSLLSYRRIAFLREHPVIEMSTLYRASKWQIFAVLVVDVEDDTLDISHITGHPDSLSQVRSRSLFDSDVPVEAQDNLLLLVTDASAEYGHSGARLVIAAVELEQTQDGVAPSYAVNWNVRMPSGWTSATARPKTTTTTTTRTTQTTTVTASTVTTDTTTTTTTTETTTDTTTEQSTATTTGSTTDVAEDTVTTVPVADEDSEDEGETNTQETEKNEDADIRD